MISPNTPQSDMTKSRRRSSSVSPSRLRITSPSRTRRNRRRGTAEGFPVVDNKSGISNDDQSLTRPRSYSVLRRFSFAKPGLKERGYQRMRKSDDEGHVCDRGIWLEHETGTGPAICEDDQSLPEPPPTLEKAQGRRSSRLSSVGSRIKSLLPVTCRRKDSSMANASAPTSPLSSQKQKMPSLPSLSIQEHPHSISETLHDTAAIEPLAYEGKLRFATSRSTDTLESFPGPSDYWRCGRYYAQPISTDGQQSFASLEWLPSFSASNTPIISAGAGHSGYAHHEDGWGRTKRSLASIFSVKKARNRWVRASDPGPNSFHGWEPSGLSAGPNFDMSIDNIGVLPTLDVASISNSHDIPYASYTPSRTSSLRLLIDDHFQSDDHGSHSPSSSLIALHPESPYFQPLYPTVEPPSPNPTPKEDTHRDLKDPSNLNLGLAKRTLMQDYSSELRLPLENTVPPDRDEHYLSPRSTTLSPGGIRRARSHSRSHSRISNTSQRTVEDRDGQERPSLQLRRQPAIRDPSTSSTASSTRHSSPSPTFQEAIGQYRLSRYLSFEKDKMHQAEMNNLTDMLFRGSSDFEEDAETDHMSDIKREEVREQQRTRRDPGEGKERHSSFETGRNMEAERGVLVTQDDGRGRNLERQAGLHRERSERTLQLNSMFCSIV